MVEIQNTAGLLRKIWIARKDPAAILLRIYGILAHPAPNLSATDGGYITVFISLAGIVSIAEPGKGEVIFARHLASPSVNLHDHFREKNDSVSRVLDDLGDRPSAPQRTVCAIY
jgi:hypothetical protein